MLHISDHVSRPAYRYITVFIRNINQVIMYTLFMHGLMDDDCAGTAYHAIATAPPGQVILPHAAPDPRGGGYL